MKKSIFMLLLLAIILAGGGLRYYLATNFGCFADVENGYRVFAVKVANSGPFSLYIHDYNWACDYPPLIPWISAICAAIFGGLKTGESQAFVHTWAGFISLCDVGIILLLVSIALPRGYKWAIGAAALWAFNPASLLDTGYWSQSTSPSLLVLVLPVAVTIKRKWFWAGICFGIACLVKPQAWPLAPAMALWIWRDGGWKSLRNAVIGGAIPIVALWFSFFCAGKAPTLWLIFRYLDIDNAYLALNGHNFWWIIEAIKGDMIRTNVIFFFGITSHWIAWIVTVVVLGCFGFLWLKIKGREKGGDGIEMLALWAMLGFLFAACMHENHALPALVLVCCAWAYGRKVCWVISILTGLIVGNILLHDMVIMCFLNGITNGNGQTLLFWPIPTANNLSLLTVLFAVVSIIFTLVWLIKFLQMETKGK